MLVQLIYPFFDARTGTLNFSYQSIFMITCFYYDFLAIDWFNSFHLRQFSHLTVKSPSSVNPDTQ